MISPRPSPVSTTFCRPTMVTILISNQVQLFDHRCRKRILSSYRSCCSRRPRYDWQSSISQSVWAIEDHSVFLFHGTYSRQRIDLTLPPIQYRRSSCNRQNALRTSNNCFLLSVSRCATDCLSVLVESVHRTSLTGRELFTAASGEIHFSNDRHQWFHHWTGRRSERRREDQSFPCF